MFKKKKIHLKLQQPKLNQILTFSISEFTQKKRAVNPSFYHKFKKTNLKQKLILVSV